MPSYQVFINRDRIKESQKALIAAAITDTHVQMTGAPDYYVQVIFNCLDRMDHYVGGREGAEILWIRGDVRPRDAQSNKNLMLALVEAVGNVCDIAKDDIWVDLTPVEPDNIVKFRTVLPLPGDEKIWFDALPEEIRHRLRSEEKQQE